MLPLVLDPGFDLLLARASPAFRKLCRACLVEVRHGDPKRAVDLIGELLATKPMGIVDRRCMMALHLALRALVGLRRTGLPRNADFRHFIANDIQEKVPTNLLRAVATDLRPKIAERTAHAMPCPNCGSAAPEIGWTPLVMSSGVPHGRFYFDPVETVAGVISAEEISPVSAHVIVTTVLARLGARAAVRGCEHCGIRFLSWASETSVEDHYSEPLGCTVELLGRPASGRANVLSHCHDQAGLPLHLDQVLGGVAGMTLYEFGCAEGIMVRALADLGATVCGSDLESYKIHFGRCAFGGTEIHDGPEYFWSLAPRSMDGAFAFHSVEHVLEPDRFFDQFARIVRPGGILAISVPNAIVGAEGQVQGMGGSHLIGFDSAGLSRFFQRHGFLVIDCQADDGRLQPARLDPVRGFPHWSGKHGDLTMIGRRLH